jgi:hypothetical protein
MKTAHAALALFALAVALPLAARAAETDAAICQTHGSAEAAPVPLDPVHPSGLLASIPVVTKLHGLTSAALAAFPPGCDRGGFQAGGRAYVLTGENTDPNVPRRAAATGRGAPVAFLAEAFDLEPALAAPPNPGAEPRATQSRYVLASALNDIMVVWRAYDAIPDDDRLKADMAAVLSGSAVPVMRFDMKGGSVQVLTP